jgi:hypothetical protein
MHSEEEFLGNEYFLFDSEWGEEYANEVKKIYGTPMKVSVSGYNFTKIKYDFGLHSRPTVLKETRSEVCFVDDENKKVVISKTNISPYLTHSVKILIATKRKEFANLERGTTVQEFLIENFLMQQGIILRSGHYYSLSEKQIQQIDKMVVGLNLYNRCKNNFSQVFVSLCDTTANIIY